MTQPASLPLALVADIGGTNTRVALAQGQRILDGSVQRFANAGHPGLDAIIAEYLATSGARPEAACIAGAGPVMDGVLSMTNLNWRIDRDSVRRATGAGFVAVLNDLQAQGHALDHLEERDLRPLVNWRGQTGAGHAAKLVIGLGTGMNAAMVFRTGDMTLVPPSESGHASLPLRSADDLRFAQYLLREGAFPSVEEALSGRGLQNLYNWHAEEAGSDKRPGAAEIMQAIAAGDDPVAQAAGRSYVSFAGRVAGDLALIQLPFGGIYFIGGVARAFAPHFAPMGLSEAFRDKGRFSDFTDQFQLCLVEDDYAALKGCAAHVSELIGARG